MGLDSEICLKELGEVTKCLSRNGWFADFRSGAFKYGDTDGTIYIRYRFLVAVLTVLTLLVVNVEWFLQKGWKHRVT